jgi:hypothetical protein
VGDDLRPALGHQCYDWDGQKREQWERSLPLLITESELLFAGVTWKRVEVVVLISLILKIRTAYNYC